MNPNACTVVLRPRSPLEVFDLTLLYLRLHARPLGRLFAVLVIPPTLLAALACWFTGGHWGVLIGALFWVPFLQPPFTVMGGHLLFAHDLGVWASLKRSVSLGVLAAPLVVGVGSAVVATISFGTGLAIWLPLVLFVPECLLLERVGFGRGLKRARLLAAGFIPASVLGVISRIWLTLWSMLVCESAGQLIVQQGFQLGTPLGSVMAYQVTPFLIFGLFAAQPLHALYRLLLYIDVRTRTEGWDLQVALHSAALAREAK